MDKQAEVLRKFKLMNIVNVSDLDAGNKALLNELILRSDKEGRSFPSVERLCQVKRIKHEKNFKGADYYLPGLVTVTKRGRGGNLYTLDIPAVEGLNSFEVVLKHTEVPPPAGSKSHPETAQGPATEGGNEREEDPAMEDKNPAQADLLPATADVVPVTEGANSSLDITEDSSLETSSTTPRAAGSSVASPLLKNKEGDIWKTDKEERDVPSPNEKRTVNPDLVRSRIASKQAFSKYRSIGDDKWDAALALALDPTWNPHVSDESRVDFALLKQGIR